MCTTIQSLTANCPNSTWVKHSSSCYLFTPYDTVQQLYLQQEGANLCSTFVSDGNVQGYMLSVENKDEHVSNNTNPHPEIKQVKSF